MTSIQSIQDAIVAEFEAFSDWDAKYKHIIQLGKALEPIDKQYQQEQYKVQGCQSTVWMAAEQKDGKVIFHGDSDALIVRGLVSLMLRVYSGQDAKTIVDTSPDFLERIEMSKHLSMQRSNGLAAMLKQMKLYATVFQLQGA